MATSRADARIALTEFFRDYLTTVPSSNIFEHEPSNIFGMSPVVYVDSNGSLSAMWAQEGLLETLQLDVHTLVYYRDLNATPIAIQSGAQDTVDQVDHDIRLALEDHWRDSEFWQDLKQNGPSKMYPERLIGGHTYKHEVRTLVIVP